MKRAHAPRCSGRFVLVAAAGLLLVTACSSASGPTGAPDGGGTVGQPGSGGSAPATGGVGSGGGEVGSSGGRGGNGALSTGGASGGDPGEGAEGGGKSGTGGREGTSDRGGTAGSLVQGTGGGTAGRLGGTGGGSTGAAGSTGSGGGGGGGASAPYNPCPPAPADCKIMPFGDSITDGYLAQRGGYRIPLFQRAHQEGRRLTFVGSAVNGPATVDGVPFPQHHEGHSAYTINDEPLPAPAHKGISALVRTSIPAYRPDIVLLMIGTNDVDNSIDLPNVPARLGALVDSIIALDAHTLIVIAQITPTMQDPLNARIQTYNAAIPAVVKARADAGKHVVLVNMYGAFVADPSYKTTLLYDRLHPNISGFQKMADTWNTVIHDLIR